MKKLNKYSLKLRDFNISDLRKIRELLESHYQKEYARKRVEIFSWISTKNPFSQTAPTYILLENDQQIIAHLGRMPRIFRINGKNVKAYYTHDTLVHPEWRHGYGIYLNNEMIRELEKATDTFFLAMWMNQFTYMFLKRRGYYELDFYEYKKLLKPKFFLERKLKNRFLTRLIAPFAKYFIAAYDFLVYLPYFSTDLSVSKTPRFDSRFDKLFDKVLSRFRIIGERKAAYLNWRYVDKPFADHTVLTLKRGNDLVGYIVLQIIEEKAYKVGIINDLLTDPEVSSHIGTLIYAALSYFRKEGVNAVICFLTDSRFIKIFRRFFFIRESLPIPVLISNLRKLKWPEFLTEATNWFLTFGDSDGYLWEISGTSIPRGPENVTFHVNPIR